MKNTYVVTFIRPYDLPWAALLLFWELHSFTHVLQKFRLIDTAGIRRKAAVASSGSTTEALSVNRAIRAIRRSDVVALVIEAMACITEQVFCIYSITLKVLYFYGVTIT